VFKYTLITWTAGPHIIGRTLLEGRLAACPSGNQLRTDEITELPKVEVRSEEQSRREKSKN
jgi:hypothetical protein